MTSYAACRAGCFELCRQLNWPANERLNCCPDWTERRTVVSRVRSYRSRAGAIACSWRPIATASAMAPASSTDMLNPEPVHARRRRRRSLSRAAGRCGWRRGEAHVPGAPGEGALVAGQGCSPAWPALRTRVLRRRVMCGSSSTAARRRVWRAAQVAGSATCPAGRLRPVMRCISWSLMPPMAAPVRGKDAARSSMVTCVPARDRVRPTSEAPTTTVLEGSVRAGRRIGRRSARRMARGPVCAVSHSPLRCGPGREPRSEALDRKSTPALSWGSVL